VATRCNVGRFMIPDFLILFLEAINFPFFFGGAFGRGA
jgi:hypothetical protein